MSILNKQIRHFESDGGVETMATLRRVIDIFSKDNEYIDDVLKSFNENVSDGKVIQVGNLRYLLQDTSELNSMAEKKDVVVNIGDIVLDKMLENEVARFTLYGISDPELLVNQHSDCVHVESRYSAKNDVLDFNCCSKFANYCKSQGWDDLVVDTIQEYIRSHTTEDKTCSARLIRPVDSETWLLRAVTSETAYRNYGINFSLLVALLTLDDFARSSRRNVWIESYAIDDSRVYASFSLGDSVCVSDSLELSFNLVLENDEIKDSSVTFTGVFKLTYKIEGRSTSLYLRPVSFRNNDDVSYSSDMLSCTHSMKVETVCEKVQNLPLYIEYYVSHVTEYAQKIVDIKNPGEVRGFISHAVKNAKKVEFGKYKEAVLLKLASVEADSIFNLFEALRSVEELFGDDIESREYWRKKLFEVLARRGKKE